MLLTIATTHRPATDLGFLLHKHPGRCQSYPLAFGKAHVFYTEASDERCCAALLLDVDPIGLVRRSAAFNRIDAYINDRPYVASSFLSTAIAQVYGTALNGSSRERATLVAESLPLRAEIACVPCRGGESLIRRVFEPLGYVVSISHHPLDETFPDWGQSRYFDVAIEARCPLQQLLRHLYVLLPVLDDDKHYWVSGDEVGKLLRHGEAWLASHPDKALIADRYLMHQRHLSRDALARLMEEHADDPDEEEDAKADEEISTAEAGLGLNELRLSAVVEALRAAGARRVLDLGCGEGKLLARLVAERSFDEVVGVDVSVGRLERAKRRLNLDRPNVRAATQARLLHGSLIYRDRRLEGFDAAALVEVIEHLDPPRLEACEQALFGAARPRTVVVTTPNVEYNVRFPNLPAGRFRHRDHRFEWSRAEFADWVGGVSSRYGYGARFVAIGPDDSEVGPPTQMAVFDRSDRPDSRSAQIFKNGANSGGNDAAHDP
jgi:3' terminal RNA ribose 2'-O-methyltransferase Hen1